ncbi:hypothetical protein COA08_27255 [Bacillus cereus]|uniref:Uncharacterized protein n=1 Tax=Bacillus cereus TaxID=1396 RepID=A0A2B1DTW8_BACCE|nr:hypothetical protein COJ43_10155 [Bacillus cereus]PGQ05326.1 hypothetical protein COA08_27255 [Bacillus cereus]
MFFIIRSFFIIFGIIAIFSLPQLFFGAPPSPTTSLAMPPTPTLQLNFSNYFEPFHLTLLVHLFYLATIISF